MKTLDLAHDLKDLVAILSLATSAAELVRNDEGRHLKPPDPHGDAENTYDLPEGQGLAGELKRWFQRQQKAVLDAIPSHETYPVPKSIDPVTDWNDPMAWAMVPYLSVTWIESGKETAGRLGLDATKWDVTSPRLKDAIHSAALKFCSSTNATTTTQLNDAVDQLRAELHTGLVEKGESIPQLRKRVGKVFDLAEQWRAQKIAATETSRAYHAAQEMAAKDSGVVAGFELLLSGDACDLCRKIATEAKRVKLGQAFAIVGHNADYSSIRHPPLHPSCQCSMIEVISPEHGGPENPGWAETLQQPQKDIGKEPYKPPKGKPQAEPEPGRARPVVTPATSTPPKDVPDRPDESHHRPTHVVGQTGHIQPPDLNLDRLRALDLHEVEPSWKLPPNAGRLSYGTVLFDDQGRVLLREPKDHFDGYHWTFAKGGKDSGEHPVDTALRETLEETGVDAAVLGLVPGGHKGGTGSTYLFIGRAKSEGSPGPETQGQRWVTMDQARELIGQTTNSTGKARDLKILNAASEQYNKLRIHPGLNDHLKPPKPPEPEPPPPILTPAKPAKPKAIPKAWPKDPNALTVVQSLGGSTGAELVQDDAGRKFIRKRGANADHLREECLADSAYQAVGAKVPKFHLYETGGVPVKLSEYLEGARTLGDVERSDPALYAKAVKNLAKHFAADALFGNWDVVGMGMDNVLVTAKGEAYRIDNGGSFRFRAQGARKTAAEWDKHPTDIWTLRDKTKNPQTSKVFSSVTAREYSAQIRAMGGKLLSLPADLAATVKDRMAQLRDVADRVELLTGDDFRDHYADQFCKHTIGIRKAGVVEQLPARMTNRGGGVTVYDENGKPWDHLRGSGSKIEKLEAYVVAQGGSWKSVTNWMSDQAGSSWSDASLALKRFLVDSRGLPASKYFWLKSADAAKTQLEAEQRKAGGAEKYAASIHAMHAFTYEYLTRADFPMKDAARGVVRLMRTEARQVMKSNNVNPGDKGKLIKRGAAESFSIYQRVSVGGSEMTRQDMPLHRVLATYWQERSKGHGGGAFLTDNENEFVCLPEGVPLDYE